MAIRLGDVAPNFQAPTTEGDIDFHEWKQGSWAVLFSHPRDFTPVCTTELGYTAKLADEFATRGVKAIGLSVDSVEDHQAWLGDIEETQGTAVNFPMIGDPDRTVADLYDMIHPNADVTLTVRSVFVIDALQATDANPIATPADWRPGDRVIVGLAVSTEDAKERFANVEEFKPYLRYADAPS